MSHTEHQPGCIICGQPTPPLDVERLLATLQDRFHEARSGTPEWRDGIRLGLQIAMNEVGYATEPSAES